MNYLGSKAASGAYQAIIASMPPHDTYIEAFLGSGAIMKRKAPAITQIGIDLDPTVLDASTFPGAELLCTDAKAFIAEFDYAISGRTLIYADPPYLPSTRTSKARYKHELTVADHIQLLTTLKSVPANIMLSGYPSELYDELLKDWRTIQYQTMTRGGVRTEKLWMNYPEDSVHWASYAGKNHTDRQRIKRKVQRWANNYAALPPAEKQAILAAILGTKA